MANRKNLLLAICYSIFTIRFRYSLRPFLALCANNCRPMELKRDF
jgi:hypothetical protein